jgi:transposase-like protein
MRAREKLTSEEKVALALDVLKRARPLTEICAYYQVSHTTAYNIRNAFLEGGRRALSGQSVTDHRLRNLETVVARHAAMIEKGRDEREADAS